MTELQKKNNYYSEIGPFSFLRSYAEISVYRLFALYSSCRAAIKVRIIDSWPYPKVCVFRRFVFIAYAGRHLSIAA